MFDRNLRRGEANVIGVYALGFVLGGLGVFIGCGDPSADDDADVGDDVVSDVDILPDVDVPMDVDDDVAEADGDTVEETEIAPVCGNGILEDGEECDDGNEMPGDGCEPGTCVFSCHENGDCLEVPDDPCTVNSCEVVTGGQACRSVPNEGASCDDGDACTDDDRCDDAGICRAGTNVCHCPGGTTEECAVHEDGDLCNGTLVCNPVARMCEVDPATVVTCPADDPCRTFTCVPETGECPGSDLALGTPCTPDGVDCTDDVCDGGGTCVHPVSTGQCLIDEVCYAYGAGRAGHPCQYCNGMLDPEGWSNRTSGTSCDDGVFCNGVDTCNASGGCVSAGDPCPETCRTCNEVSGSCDVVEGTCWIAGACWTDGAGRFGYPCQYCESTSSRTGWTNRTEGSLCDDGLWCNGVDACDAAGTCVSGTTERCPETCRTCNETTDTCDLVGGFCWVDGACWADGVQRPWNLCQFCDAVGNPGTWTHRPTGYSCDDGLWCTGTDTCNATGGCVSAGDPCPETCRTCNDTDDRCDVTSGCWIDGACYAEGAVRAGYPCQYCNGASSRTSWTNRAVGYSCDDGVFCTGVDACNASGTCVSAGDPCPETCRTCNESADRCDVAAGSCWIDGACWTNGTARPGYPCQYCNAGASPAAWANRTAGTSCDDGVFCNGADTCNATGGCVSAGDPCPETCRTCNETFDRCDVVTGCWIDGACYAEGAVRAGYPCQYCNGASSRTSWTNRATGYSCNDGLFCTGVDACSATGICVSPGDPCTPGTEACNEVTDSCDPLTCTIGGTTYLAGAANPANQCEWCRPAVSTAAWTPRPDFTPCTLVTAPDYSYDICVRGTCVSPGTCGDASCNAPGPNWPIPDTNQRNCYDESMAIVCPAAPGSAACSTTAFCGQDAQYGWDTTNPASARFMRTGSTQPIVTDNVTGLMWQGCPAGQTGPSCTGTAGEYAWASALSYCDGLTWGGYSDWRSPDRYELQTIVDYGRSSDPYIDPTAFPATPGHYFWSASSWSSSASLYGCYVNFLSGHVYNTVKTHAANVRCVRREPYAVGDFPRFVRTVPTPEQPVVEDTRTGLIWQGCPAGFAGPACATGSLAVMTWRTALGYCEGLDWGGRTDWYLPNVLELTSIVDDSRSNPAIDTTAFPATSNHVYSTSSSFSGVPSTAWYVYFYDGYVTRPSKTDGRPVRCVSRGP